MTSQPMSNPEPMSRRCTARRRDGQRCGQPAMLGTNVCRLHGGKSPHVQRAARLRLLELVDPAITTMAKIMNNPNTAEKDRLRAAENILDRAGYPRAVQVDSDSARQLLLQRLQAMQEQAIAEQDRLVGEAREIVEGHAVIEQDESDGGQSPENPP